MLSVQPLFWLLFTTASVQGEKKSVTKMSEEGNLTKPLSGLEQQMGSASNILQVQNQENQTEGEDDSLYLNDAGHAENGAIKDETEKNLEKRKLAMGLAILSRPDGGGAGELGMVQQKQPENDVAKNTMNSGDSLTGESSIVASWRRKVPLTKDVIIKPKAAMGLRKMSGPLEKAEDEDFRVGDVMPGPGKEILDTLNAWHEHRWHRLLDEYKIRGEGTSGISKGWQDTIMRNWPTQSREKEKVEDMKVRMKMKMKDMEEKVKLQKEGNNGIEVPDLGKVWLNSDHGDEEREEDEEVDNDILISLPALGEARIPSRRAGQRQEAGNVKRRRRVFRRQQVSPSFKPVKNSQSRIQKLVEISEGIRDEPMKDLDSKLSLADLPRASSSLAMRGLHLLKTALQRRPSIPTRLVDRFDPPRSSLLMRGLTMLRTALQPPPAAPPTVVERFPLPPRVRRPSTLVSLIRLAWEKLTPTLTIR